MPCQTKNIKEIYYQYEDEIEAPASDVTIDIAIATTPVTASTAVSTPSSGQVASMEDVPVKVVDILLVIFAQKLKKRVEIPLQVNKGSCRWEINTSARVRLGS
jgi:fatty acid synthase subunit alpha